MLSDLQGQELQRQIDSLNALLVQKDEQIAQLQRDLNIVYQLCRYGDKLGKPNNIFIPERMEWNEKSPTEIFLDSPNGKITVITSSTWEGAMWNPKWLFNGKLATPDQQGWASGKGLPAYIEVHFDNPVSANFLTITSRTYNLEFPTSFEIYGGHNSSDFKKLGEYSNIAWQISQEQRFSFVNDVAYHVYKINFLTASGSPYPCVSLTKLNLGRIDIHNENSQ